MKYVISLFLIFLLISGGDKVFAQNITIEGLWLVENVNVGSRNLTPVAKWTRINAGGTYESGNGWLKHSEGIWTYNSDEQTFHPKENNGLTDPYGPFSVQFEGEKMKWIRNEEGQKVTVTFSPINEIPKSPADKVQGLWDLVSARVNEKDITQEYDPEGQHYIFIKWDRNYLQRTSKGEREGGYWNMNAHKPEITFISYTDSNEKHSWKVQFNEGGDMLLTGIDDENQGQKLTYKRRTAFPE